MAKHLTPDERWPRAGEWIVPLAKAEPGSIDLAVLGVPAYRTAITPGRSDSTPAAVREALMRYTPYCGSSGVDVSTLRAVDFGDVEEPDGPEGEGRVAAAVARTVRARQLLVAIGGDNSITYSVMRGLFLGKLDACGLVTIDAHHDLRDGESNGSPVRRLIDAGLPGTNVVQIGISDFANSAEYSQRARDLGITVIRRDELHRRNLPEVVSQALEIAGADGRPIYVDVDVDVCDRAAAPGCPASTPGGISADELRQMVRLLCRAPGVRGMDIAEVDASKDSADGRTVRLAALLILEAAAGLAARA